MATLGLYITLILFFIGILITTSISISTKFEKVLKAECQKIRDETFKKFPSNTEWDVEKLEDVFKAFREIEEKEHEYDSTIGGLMQLSLAMVVFSVIGFILTTLQIFLDWIGVLDFILVMLGVFFGGEIVPLSFRLAKRK